ncbi:pro-sigmaK processing inhibitor BofA [Brevibacillus fluminis]|uniref:Pro-sigmaK processing inhibitor BofA n=1 Tax=Brevibacillus fluminis TaxID=511487 RepID=A0A3M8D672_9BACL|nr:pro-sigmaK processing inhibitor BofA family protein [Brevibacillus fluminis]RNB82725.1 pro-sigmaK processing inhibitor BofA [Brevibacillus fluminis]
MGLEWGIGIVIVGFLLVVAASKSVTKPLRWAGVLALQFVIGAVLLFFANIIGEMAGYHIPINPVTAFLTGFLRIPGVLAMVVIKLYLV